MNKKKRNKIRQKLNRRPKPKQLNTERRVNLNRLPFSFDENGQVVSASDWALRTARHGLEKEKRGVWKQTLARFGKRGLIKAAYLYFLREARIDAAGTRDKAYGVLKTKEDELRETQDGAPAKYAAERSREVSKAKDKVPFAPEQNIGVLLAKQGVIGSLNK